MAKGPEQVPQTPESELQPGEVYLTGVVLQGNLGSPTGQGWDEVMLNTLNMRQEYRENMGYTCRRIERKNSDGTTSIDLVGRKIANS